MNESLTTLLGPGGRLLVACATPLEARGAIGWSGPTEALGDWAVHRLTDRLDFVITGVGKVNAGAAVARRVRPEHRLVMSIGIAGVLPGSDLAIGDVVIGERSVYADEGLERDDGRFQGCASMGFPLGPFDDTGVRGDAGAVAALRALPPPTGGRLVTGVIATVSTCSGTDARAQRVRAITGAGAEAMEGAACGHVAARLYAAFVEVRSISNTTGDRSRQRWDIPRALDGLRAVLGPALGL